MTRVEIQQQIALILKTVVGHEDYTLTDELSAKDVAGWDSLTHMIIISDVESAFKIRFRLRELSRLENLGSLIDLIESKLNT